MKRNLVLFFVGASMVMACQQNQIDVQQMEDDVFYAAIENDDQTRTTLDDNNNVMWSANDQLTIFKKSSINSKYQVTSSSAGKTTGTFTKVYAGNDDEFTAGGELDHNVAVYPYQEQLAVSRADDADIASRYEIEGMVLPEEQEYVANSFAEGSFPMAAVSLNNELVFRNVCGGIKLQLKGTQKVTSVRIQGNDKEKLAGNAVLTVYADEDLKPALTMASDAVKSVTLDCGDGVQLTESSATEFIIALPPVLFSKGFTATVTASDGQTYTVQTDKANTVLRSSLLVMPVFDLNKGPESGEDDLQIPVSSIVVTSPQIWIGPYFREFEINEGDEVLLVAEVKPRDATDKTVEWASANPSIAMVNQSGLVVGVSEGTTTISAIAGGVTCECKVAISPGLVSINDYIDEYGINHGKGIPVGKAVWAPVNCGYHMTDYKYGKLYQWGRKYGQGYSGPMYDINGSNVGSVSDATTPEVEEGGISAITGNHINNANIFYLQSPDNSDWTEPQDPMMWNSGTDEKPIKTDYDPCPSGWRVPTYEELTSLCSNNSSPWLEDESGQLGRWYSGIYLFDDATSIVFLQAAGVLDRTNGKGARRGEEGVYWSSNKGHSAVHSYAMGISSSTMGSMWPRSNGCSVRCVQE